MKTLVIVFLNTDLIMTGIKQFPKKGEHVFGKELIIAPGGKSRNIADMIAHLVPDNSVAMVGRTVKDPYGFWEKPIQALKDIGVNTDYVNIQDFEDVNKRPGIAFIPVDEEGNNEIFVMPEVSEDFSTDDIDRAEDLFKEIGQNKGMLVLTLECPLKTAIYTVKKANEHGLKVMFDPGGIRPGDNIDELIEQGVYLIKPNEHEATSITGVEVNDFDSAKLAAQKLHSLGIPNVLITVGAKGAYLFCKGISEHIPVPEISVESTEQDETGCGDQTMAALCAYLQDDLDMVDAVRGAILAGTLQFHKSGVRPITKEEIDPIK